MFGIAALLGAILATLAPIPIAKAFIATVDEGLIISSAHRPRPGCAIRNARREPLVKATPHFHSACFGLRRGAGEWGGVWGAAVWGLRVSVLRLAVHDGRLWATRA
jgi:hypothetical protein